MHAIQNLMAACCLIRFMTDRQAHLFCLDLVKGASTCFQWSCKVPDRLLCSSACCIEHIECCFINVGMTCWSGSQIHSIIVLTDYRVP